MNAIQVKRTEEEYEDYLRDIYSDVDICGISCDAVDALKLVDETSFHVGYADWSAEEGNEVYECTRCDTAFDDKDDAEACCEDISNEEFDSEFIATFDSGTRAYLGEVQNHNDMSATYRTIYSEMVDSYQKEGRISQRQADNFTFNGDWD